MHSEDEDRPVARSKAELVRTWIGVASLLVSTATLIIVVITKF